MIKEKKKSSMDITKIETGQQEILVGFFCILKFISQVT